ncbi:hypothetical protein Cylst_1183 [Cylindrospermum stagnale PCC 7417]|uniref:Uncharacterized protein n=1 Tax=Cylindrospermum stagnale PCC 7417 TaxID=56107 RepID=K9WSX5_9NOST|nr:hypothetical protein [Cylindrospermum stagnale]AFZ23485.1 hypothetical protein Cylst_1183 [Cylindrospermum stagnale PCC 7417]
MVTPANTADFGFRIDFAQDTEDPGRIFRAFSGLIDFCQVTDKILIKSLDLDIEPALLLSDIQQGSITVWLKNVLNYSPDKNSKHLDLKRIIDYLVQVKSHIFVDFIKARKTIQNKEEILDLQNTFIALAKNANTNELYIYTPPSDKDLLYSIDKLQLPLSELQAADKLYYLTPKSNFLINQDFSISQEARDNLLVEKTIESESEMILKVKKPDYLGESKWEFKDNRRKVEAKISDLDWLNRFKQREVAIYPGDAVKAKVKTVSKYDSQGELISINYTIEKVIEVIPEPPKNQLSIFPEKDLDNNK